jgi:threonylcarbamoyladenosine tRNA methylthiotransferase CDKAL1
MTVRVYIEEGGCDRRQLDAATIRSYLNANDYILVDDPREADRILVVTCAFKSKEEEASLRRLRSLRKYGRDILVYGCLPAIAGKRFAEFSDLPTLGPSELEDIGDHFEGTRVPFAEIRSANVIEPRSNELVRARRRIEAGLFPWQEVSDRIRKLRSKRSMTSAGKDESAYNLFVSRGCRGTCSYCAIKKAIGSLRSKLVDEVVAELRQGIGEGYRTFNIVADDPGCYGLDRSSTFPQLLRALLDASDPPTAPDGSHAVGEDVTGFYIRDIHPKYLVLYHGEMLDIPLFSRVSGILCPVQSGSDRILELMCREHTSADLLEVMRRLRGARSDMVLDTQIIAGFPTETEDDFERTLSFVRDAEFDSVLVFPYDNKEDTPASKLTDQVPPDVIQRRVRDAFRFFRREGIDAYYSCP